MTRGDASRRQPTRKSSSARVAFGEGPPDPGLRRRRQLRIAVEQALGFVARDGTQRLVTQGIRHAEGRHAALPLAEQIPHAAQPQIGARDLESVVGLLHHAEALGDLGADVA